MPLVPQGLNQEILACGNKEQYGYFETENKFEIHYPEKTVEW